MVVTLFWWFTKFDNFNNVADFFEFAAKMMR